MAYRIRFQPKKSKQEVPATISSNIRAIFDQFKEVREKNATAGLDDLVDKIKHHGSLIVQTSNLRTIVAPDDETKARQKLLLKQLERLPMHRAAHGFVKHRDALSCAQAHVTYWGRNPHGLVVLNMDAKNFFHSVTSPHIRRALEGHGIEPKNATAILDHCTVKADGQMAVAVLEGLTRMRSRLRSLLSTPDVPDELLEIAKTMVSAQTPWGRRLAFVVCQVFLSLGHAVTASNRFLPQGAPTSPFLSNLTMKLADIRISALAKKFNGFYTRYADDFTVSWLVPTKGRYIDGTYRCVRTILMDYGVALNEQKKRVMGTSKPQDIVGYCINSGRPTISRRVRRRLRAALHNEMVRGSANLRTGKRRPNEGEDYDQEVPNTKRLEHLQGLISYVSTAHPKEAARGNQLINHIRYRSAREPSATEFTHDQVQLTVSGELSRDLSADPENDDKTWG